MEAKVAGNWSKVAGNWLSAVDKMKQSLPYAVVPSFIKI
jgi:hypothetical protein